MILAEMNCDQLRKTITMDVAAVTRLVAPHAPPYCAKLIASLLDTARPRPEEHWQIRVESLDTLYRSSAASEAEQWAVAALAHADQYSYARGYSMRRLWEAVRRGGA